MTEMSNGSFVVAKGATDLGSIGDDTKACRASNKQRMARTHTNAQYFKQMTI